MMRARISKKAVACALGAIVGAALAAMLPACSEAADEPVPANGGVVMDEKLKADLQLVQGAKILFGHHSVGDNLLQGLKELAAEAQATVNIAEERVGKNGDPKSKVDAFVTRVLAEPEGKLDLAFMKFCYADFEPMTNPDQMVGWYKDAVDRIRKERPQLSMMHVTAPLMAHQTHAKARVKRFLGRDVWEDTSEIRRVEYNEKLKEAFKGEPLFDLAAFESTRPSGQKEVAEYNGRQVPVLHRGYTNDGGHLNELGRRMGGRAFAQAIAETLRKRAAAEPPKDDAADRARID